MKILHITSWYPTKESPKTAVWVHRHLEALESVGVSNTIYHVEAAQGKLKLSLGKKEIYGNKSYRVLTSFPWFIQEVVSIILVLWVLFIERKNDFEAINFHIAYPNLVYWHRVKKWIKIPIVITEHWSAYHFKFGRSNTDELPRVQKIFNQRIPLITVSQSLQDDISNFSKLEQKRSYIIPNIVDTNVFTPSSESTIENRFFMVSQWKYPKDPFIIIDAFYSFSKNEINASLIIGGFGPQLNEMKQKVHDLGLEKSVTFLGMMSSEEIAVEMNCAQAFIHLSHYETFSVVCAEALCCGCPVIALDSGGLTEFIQHEKNGYLLDNLSISLDQITKTMNASKANCFDRKGIADDVKKLFSSHVVGVRYYDVLKELIYEY